MRLEGGDASGIVIDRISVRFATQGKSVVADLSLHVAPGEFLCLIGPSGSGKSTLLKAIAGFVKPAAGRITVNGHSVVGPDSDRGMVFQEYALFPWLTVAGNILFGNRVRKLNAAERSKVVEHYLSLVHLERYASYYPSQLSGGMKQRVALARAWANGPDVLLLDEPFGALDALTRRELQDELLRIWEADRRSCVFVTHDVAEAVYLADRVVRLSSDTGRIARITPIELPRPRARNSIEFTRAVAAVEEAA